MTGLIQLIFKIKDLTTIRKYIFIKRIYLFYRNYMMAQNILINKNKILTSCYNIVLYICMRL